jgi:hypothetical protein
MSVPAITLNQLDNQVGVVDPGDGDRLAIVASAPLATVAVGVPTLLARKSDVAAAFGAAGPLPEAMCYAIDQTGKPVLGCRAGDTITGTYTAVVETGTGTSVVTTDAAVEPYDDYEAVLKFITGGTIGVAGITFQWSLDGGRNYSVVTALGTANNYTIAEGNVKFNFGAGTIVAGDTASTRTSGQQWNNAELGAAIDALINGSNRFELLMIEGPMTAADVATCSTKRTAAENVGKEITFLGGFRLPTIGESEATYLAAFITAMAATSFDGIAFTFGGSELQSSISQRRYLRRPVMDLGACAVSVRAGQDLAEVGERAVSPRPPTVRIKDDANNPKHHDELINPGADDARAVTYRSWNGRQGVFWNNVPLLSQTGSDFKYLQHRRVMNIARRVVRSVLEEISSADLLVNPETGKILEEEASAIDSLVNAALFDALISERNASDAQFQLSRTDNILSTFTLKGALKVTPLAYAKQIIADVGYYNPALKAVYPEL